ncbi:MAG: M23 family metallopeptidase [Clostridiaceae bacterium]|nr:M23 family metallopeptidase [Clostridiaceae bacterium]
MKSKNLLKLRKRVKERNYWSILLVPHSTNDVKVIKISSLRYKLMTLATIVLTAIACFGIFLAYMIYENRSLEENLQVMSASNKHQMKMSQESAKLISELSAENTELRQMVSDFKVMYREMTENYIEKRSDNITVSRSGNINDRSFINDVNKLKGILDNLEEINSNKPDIISNISETEEKLKKYIESIPTLWPTSGRISSNFGIRSDPFNFSEKSHEGLDIAGSHGQIIKASASGKVIHSDWYKNYGKTVIIDHGYGISTLYAHCSSLLVKEGQEVKKGDSISKVGSTGRSTGDHLHFEVRVNNSPVNPLEYLDPK